MTVDRSQARINAYDRGMELLKAAEFGECMCETCITERKAKVFPEAARLVYAQLRFIPERYTKHEKYSNNPEHALGMIKDIRAYNETMRRWDGTRYYFCKWCGLKHDNQYTHKGDRYCNNCWSSLFVCAECDEVHLHLGRPVGNLRDKDDCHEFVRVCTNCVPKMVRCGNCSVLEHPQLVTKVVHGRDEIGNLRVCNLCRHCEGEEKAVCSRCGRVTYGPIAHRKKDHTFCPVCTEEAGGVMSYDYKPLLPHFQHAPTEGKVTKNAFHMGFEIEMAPVNSFIPPEAMIHMLKERIGRDKVYAMDDGSISQATTLDGMEIASHPFTWEYYKKHGYKTWDAMCLYLRKHEWKANVRGLGIHVHTTKAAWGTHQIYKLLKFIHDEQSFVQRIAQRTQSHYCQYDNLDEDNGIFMAKNKRNDCGGHYNAINLNNGESGKASKTIEFRIFQATLEPLYFHKAIEFTYACYKFTREYPTNQMNRSAFYDFCYKHWKEFPCLYEFMINLNRGDY